MIEAGDGLRLARRSGTVRVRYESREVGPLTELMSFTKLEIRTLALSVATNL